MAQESDGSQPGQPSEQRSRVHPRIVSDDTVHEIYLPPQSRYRHRADGGMDETYRVNFSGALKPAEMRRVTELLLATIDEGAPFGITALTKVKFVEPDTLEYRYWCAEFHSDRPNVIFGLWYRLNEIHPVVRIDGIEYSRYFPARNQE